MEERLNHPMPIMSTKLIVGLFFAVVGVLMAAGNLQLRYADRVLRFWPVVVLVIGLVKLADPARRVLGLVLTVVGASLLAHSAGWVRFTIFDLWPVLLIGAGMAMVARSLGFGDAGDASPDARQQWSVLNNRKVEVTSPEFTGARVAAFMGGWVLDLTEADIAHGPAVIDAVVMMGGIEIYVPDGWEIIGDVVPIMAGFEIKAAPTTDPTRQLIVRGMALMAGIEVKRRKS